MTGPVGGASQFGSGCMKGKPTSFDIAYHAGVSQATVSRALRGSPLVSLDTRRRIQAIAKQLNYKVDKNASSLRRQHATTLALLLFEDPTPDDAQVNPFPKEDTTPPVTNMYFVGRLILLLLYAARAFQNALFCSWNQKGST